MSGQGEVRQVRVAAGASSTSDGDDRSELIDDVSLAWVDETEAGEERGGVCVGEGEGKEEVGRVCGRVRAWVCV